MWRFSDATWWYWLATVGLLAIGLFRSESGVYLAIVLTAVQVVHFALHKRSWTGFPVQVRIAYLAMLVAGLWKPLQFLHWIQLIGTSAVVLVDYCLLARVLSLLPWNRTQPFSLGLVRRTIFSRPVRGSILHASHNAPPAMEPMCSLRPGASKLPNHYPLSFPTTTGECLMTRIAVLAYGVVNYATFGATFLYLAGFVGNLLVPKSMDSAAVGPLWQALLVNTLLVGVFAAQHSVMARPGFKRWWTRFVPAPIERSTYVLCTNLALILLFWQWRPTGGVIWDVQYPIVRSVIYALFAFGWLTVLVTTFLINHFDLFGLRQVWLYFLGQPYTHLRFVTPGPYKLIRHPLYIGWMTAFWATPTMTAAHLAFSVGMTAYMLIAIQFEERDLRDLHGDRYAAYRRRVPMLIPSLFRTKSVLPAIDESAKPIAEMELVIVES